MIQAEHFIYAAQREGFALYTGVPCSYLTPFIDTALAERSLTYIAAANEGDAVATAAGAALGGIPAIAMMQNSGLGNAVSPLTSLTHVFRLPVLLIITWRGDPSFQDEPQHALMGEITPDLLDNMQIPWAWFPTEPGQIQPAIEQAKDYMLAEQRPFALLMRKGSVKPSAKPSTKRSPSLTTRRHGLSHLAPPELNGQLATRHSALAELIRLTSPEDSIVLTTTGYTGRELYAIEDRPNQLYMVGSMGCVSSLGLGLALALKQQKNQRVVLIDGDGAALMRMGNLATLGSYAPDNLVHIVLDNGVYDSTGAQATVAPNVDFAAIANACGYPVAHSADNLQALTALLSAPSPGATFLHLRIAPGTTDNLPRPSLSPEQVKARLMQHLAQTQRQRSPRELLP